VETTLEVNVGVGSTNTMAKRKIVFGTFSD
jgi:hypothetical protein